MTAPTLQWPASDFTRVPYRVFMDEDVGRLEQERVFDRNWCYLGLAIEVPEPGDFITTYVGRTQVILSRDAHGDLAAFVNSCSHRGAQVVRRLRGNATSHTCPYHQWCFSTTGELLGLPLLKGVKGRGGMPADFDKKEHGLKRMRIDEYNGLVFGTFSSPVETLFDYLGPRMRPQIDRIFDRKPRILGYYRQRIPSNWKLYLENLKDHHGALLHLFHATFGIARPTMTAKVTLDIERGHSFLRLADIDEVKEETRAAYAGTDKYREDYRLEDPSLFDVTPDYDDKVTNVIMSLFPNLMLGQIANTFQTRSIRPKGKDEFELFWTYFGFEDDDDTALEGKLRQSNFIGPAGYISAEDGEAGRMVQMGIASRPDDSSFVEMGGRGAMEDADNISTEVAVRAFWKRYAEAMSADGEAGR
jgi:anthranilate 1,2-dioxygenase large subunit